LTFARDDRPMARLAHSTAPRPFARAPLEDSLLVRLTVTIGRNADGWPSAQVTASAAGRDGRATSASATEAHHSLPAKAAGKAAKRAVAKLIERLD
jgi:hypothetical protein